MSALLLAAVDDIGARASDDTVHYEQSMPKTPPLCRRCQSHWHDYGQRETCRCGCGCKAYSSSFTTTTTPLPPRSALLRLPLELRHLIYSHLLVAPATAKATWGSGSGICTSILRTCRQVHCEALPLLYRARHYVRCSPPLPPRRVLARMSNIELEIRFSTNNRADYEESIDAVGSLYYITDRIGLSLRNSQALAKLTISLLNTNQRKRGPKPLRSQTVRATMQRMLLPFASLHAGPAIEISGFDFSEWAELFDEMREKYRGAELPIDMLLT